MLKVWGKIVKDNKIIRDEVVTSNIEATYQENLKACILELCYKMDISKPYWLKINMDQYNRNGKVMFTKDNFVEDIDFDKFIVEELETEKKHL